MTTPKPRPGGKRSGSGRPKGTGKPTDAARTRQLRINATAAEWQKIMDALTPEQRTEALLRAIE